MRPCLCTSTSTDVILNLNPIFPEYFKALDEFFVLFLCPSTSMRIDVLRGFPLKSSTCYHLRCLILLLSHIWISEAHALGGSPYQAEVILIERRFILVSNSAIRRGLLILQCGFPLSPGSGWLLTGGLSRIIINEILRLCVISESTICIYFFIISVFSDAESIPL